VTRYYVYSESPESRWHVIVRDGTGSKAYCGMVMPHRAEGEAKFELFDQKHLDHLCPDCTSKGRSFWLFVLGPTETLHHMEPARILQYRLKAYSIDVHVVGGRILIETDDLSFLLSKVRGTP
jgi:hypothetical protein